MRYGIRPSKKSAVPNIILRYILLWVMRNEAKRELRQRLSYIDMGTEAYPEDVPEELIDIDTCLNIVTEDYPQIQEQLRTAAVDVLSIVGYDQADIRTDLNFKTENPPEGEAAQIPTVGVVSEVEDNLEIGIFPRDCGDPRIEDDTIALSGSHLHTFRMCQSSIPADTAVLLSSGFLTYGRADGDIYTVAYSHLTDFSLDRLLDDLSPSKYGSRAKTSSE